MPVLRVLDVETTGFLPDASVCEIGYTDVTLLQGRGIIHSTYSYLVRPKHPISLEAMAVHHITEREVAEKAEVDCDRAIAELSTAPIDIWVAHNAPFEQKFLAPLLAPPSTKWIDTLKVGRHLWPGAPSHSNQVLKYYLGLPTDEGLTHPAHRAGPDTYVTAHILLKALEHGLSPQEMVEISTRPSLLTTCYLPKHKGKKWADVPKDYLRWIMTWEDFATKEQAFQDTVHYWANH